MLAEHFVGNMDNGADFSSGWDKPAWEWDNVMMLSRKPQSGDWSEEPVIVASSVSSGIPGLSATASPGPASICGSSQRSYPERNSSLPETKPIVGFSSPVKHEKSPQIENASCLDLTTRSTNGKAEKKVNGVIAAVDKLSNSGANQQKDFFLGLGPDKGEADGKEEGTKEAANGNHDADLKLALKRTFTPDSVAAATSPGSNNNNTNTSNNNNNSNNSNNNNSNNKGPSSSSPSKKPRGSANHTPRCQVEGCKTDLSSAKDYHRRHKVCAMHSKSAKVCVNSIEQRFCQQCSRFHVLSEFDEGKRSCRRRLAGHNERRRKPQPDPMALTTAAALSPYHAGFVRLAQERLLGYGSYFGLNNLHGKINWPRLGIDEHTGLLSNSSNLSSRPEGFVMLFPHRKGPMLNNFGHGVHQFMQGSGSMGQNLSLSSSSGTGVYANLGPNQAPQGVTGVSDSGRALSLLSSPQSWAATSPHDSMEQLMSENHRASYSYSGSSPGAGRQASYASQPLPGAAQGAAGGGSLNAVPLDSHRGGASQSQGNYLPSLGVNNYENPSVLTLLQESELRGLQDQHARPTIDLMQMSTPQATTATAVMQSQPQQQQQPPQHSGGSDFQVLKPYVYDHHPL